MNTIAIAFEIMAKGMGGIFVVMVLVMLLVAVLGRIGVRKK